MVHTCPARMTINPLSPRLEARSVDPLRTNMQAVEEPSAIYMNQIKEKTKPMHYTSLPHSSSPSCRSPPLSPHIPRISAVRS